MKSWVKEKLAQGLKYDEIIGLVNDEIVGATLISTFGNQTKAASALNLHRGTLSKYIREKNERGA